MKFLYSFLFLVVTIAVRGQTTITVDAGNVLKALSGNENGINVNYLMDGSYLTPGISSAQSIRNASVGLLRYPGGEKSDNYLFSVSPYTSSSPRVALLGTCFWPSNNNNFVDTQSGQGVCRPSVLDFDEFMSLCQSTGASPLVVVAYDAAYNASTCSGIPTKAELITNAVEWVRYANVSRSYNVKYWMIGNESWNDAEYNGRVSPAQYASDIAEFASAMKAVDPSIKIIANGKSGWWQTILQSSAVSLIDFLAFSEYPVSDYTGGYAFYRENDVNLTAEVDKAIDDINAYAAGPHKSRIKVIAAEYNSIDWSDSWASSNNVGHALVNFQMFGDMVIKPKLEAACMWNTRWMENADKPQSLYDAFDMDGNLNANGMVMNAWGSNLLSEMVESVSSSNYVKSYSSYDDSSKRLNIFLLNKDDVAKDAEVIINNYSTDFTGSVWQFRGASVDDKFPDYSKVDSIFEPVDVSSITLPANSITVLRLQKDDVVLPVNLINFEAKKNERRVVLQWETADEENLSDYILERSSDGEQFDLITTIPAKNVDSSEYLYVDSEIAEVSTLYYRLVVVQANGSRVSSRIVAVSVNPQITAVVVQPNPFEDRLQLKVRSEKEKSVSVILFDMLGRVAYKQTHRLIRGNNVIELLQLKGISRGMHFLRVGDDEYSSTLKVLKR